MYKEPFHHVALSDQIDLPGNSLDWTQEQYKAHDVLSQIDIANVGILETDLAIAEETAKINDQAATVARLDNWWGRMTGQHLIASTELERVTKRSEIFLEGLYAEKEAKAQELADQIAGVIAPEPVESTEEEALDM